MDTSASDGLTSARLRRAIVLRVQEDSCEVIASGRRLSVGHATLFPSPRTERVSPGHLVAVAPAPDGSDVVVWRWYDAVVLEEEARLSLALRSSGSTPSAISGNLSSE